LGDSSDFGIVIGNYGDPSVLHAVLYEVLRSQWFPLPDVPNRPQNFGNGINNRGVGTGGACNGNDCTGWTWTWKGYDFFYAPGSDPTKGGAYANGINDRGQVVGTVTDSNGIVHGFLKGGDDFTIIDEPDAAGYTSPYGINDREEIVGAYADSSGVMHGFVESRGNFTSIDVLGSTVTVIYGINSRSDLAGTWLDMAGAIHGFVTTSEL
jgi:hypothetical protein